jgi:O-antigen/teichoic acid export membrane protein
MPPQPRPARSTLRALVEGSAVYAIGNVLPRLGLFLLLPVYTLGMGPAEFGRFSLMISLAGLLTIVFRLGLDGALMRLQYEAEPADRGPWYWTLAAVTVLTGVAFSLFLATLGAPLFALAFPGIELVPTGLIAFGIAATAALQYIPTTRFRTTDRPGRVLAFGVAVFLASAVVTLWLVLILGAGALGGLLGQLAAGGATVAITLAVLARQRFGLSLRLAREGLAFGLPLVPHSVAAWVLNLSDRWLIGALIVNATLAHVMVGIYTLGYQLGQIVALVAFSVNAAWVPFFYQRGEGPHGPALLRELTTLSMGGLAMLGVSVSLLTPEAVAVLAPDSWGPDASLAVLVTPLVALACLIQGLYLMAVSPIFLQRRTAVLPLITIAAGALNVALNVILIPVVGIVGAGLSTVVGYTTLALLTIWYARRSYDLQIDAGRVCGLIVAAILVVTAARFAAPEVSLSALAVHLAAAAGFVAITVALLRQPWRTARRLVPASSAT